MITLHGFEVIRANLDGCAFSTYPLIVFCVPLRIWCRVNRVGRKGIGWDDILCIVALLLHSAFFFTCMLGLRPWLGKHAGTEVSIPHVVDFLRNLFVAQLLYTVCITLNKATILAFYWRLFSVRSRIPILAVTAVVVAWFVAIFFCVLFTCIPVTAQWDISITNAKCISTRSIWIGGSIVNVVTDVVLLIMPLPYVWNLNAPMAQRLALGGMFCLGAFVSVVSIVRLSIMLGLDLNSSDATFNFSEVVIWSMVEINCGLICACLPSLRPAVRLLGLGRLFGGTSGHTGQPSGGRATPGPDSSDALKPYRRQSRKNPGLFSMTATERPMTGFEGSDEDSYAMIEHSRDKCGITTTSVEPAKSSISEDRSASDRLPVGIEVKRDWVISGEPVHTRHGV
ncbi:hypothetical protein D0869_00326 [Hortaea werneckii]|uniref:Rhodopsin domain-containing protein n=1 Tax=Hortaea werneckii TaxID=91943 RepID=A0A3M7BM52_HORWE|nr:hypothetical protein D0869_00326 [Hortaea werneckii]RMY06458.1 hypothetical protein D0868_05860 [Hortaea werneckii]RMY24036.1 hypothetical protein D0867_01639 [Hortaea werneckii]RMY40831.1 hypothetical protein D0866_00999 [Hortaea werneckii]